LRYLTGINPNQSASESTLVSKMLIEPLGGKSHDFLQCARFLKQMGSGWNDDEFLIGTVELRQRFPVHPDHRLIIAANDQQRGRRHGSQCFFCEIRSASSGTTPETILESSAAAMSAAAAPVPAPK
jgi:hypothetical protein